ncbi:MAG: helix-turn-helix domain-containing protein [Desulfurococcaceae archaeon]
MVPSKREVIDEFLDLSKSYTDVKHVDVINLPGLPQLVVVVKRNYGVLRALQKVGGVKVDPVTVVGGFKYFPAFIPRGSKAELIKYVRAFSPCDVDVALLKPSTTAILKNHPVWAQRLTKHELYVLRIAYEEGYFDWPRRVKLEELAARLGVSKPTVAEHLRKALKKLLNSVWQAQQLSTINYMREGSALT